MTFWWDIPTAWLKPVHSDGEFFTMERLVATLDAPASSAKDLLDRIAAGVQEHIGEADQFDDVTLLSIP